MISIYVCVVFEIYQHCFSTQDGNVALYQTSPSTLIWSSGTSSLVSGAPSFQLVVLVSVVVECPYFSHLPICDRLLASYYFMSTSFSCIYCILCRMLAMQFYTQTMFPYGQYQVTQRLLRQVLMGAPALCVGSITPHCHVHLVRPALPAPNPHPSALMHHALEGCSPTSVALFSVHRPLLLHPHPRLFPFIHHHTPRHLLVGLT